MRAKYLISALVLGLVLVGAFLVPAEGTKGALAIVPPLLAICLAFATGNVYISLLLGVVAGGMVQAGGNPFSGLVETSRYVKDAVWDKSHGITLAFIFVLMAMSAVMTRSGGMHGIVEKLARYARSARSTQVATAFMGLLVFFDDYANCLVVGTSMRPLTDRYGVSRAKLAYLVDATAAPISGLALISTWVGYEVGLFSEALKTIGSSVSGYEMFLQVLPYRFYCILTLGFVFLCALMGRDFGPMYAAERTARTTGSTHAPDAERIGRGEATGATLVSGRWLNAALPILMMIALGMSFIFVDGGGLEVVRTQGLKTLSLRALGTIFSGADTIRMLTYAALISFALAMALPLIQRVLRGKEVVHSALQGMWASRNAVLILLLAWSLGNACKGAGTAEFLTAIAKNTVAPWLIPAVVFVLASAIGFATGTSWGTMAILIPAVVPLAHTVGGIPLATITMGCVLDGAIFGDHCSPVSDTTIMSSIASRCRHIAHVNTQLPYALTVMLIALGAGYLLAPQGVPPAVSYLVGGVVMVIILRVVGKPVEEPLRRVE